MTDLESDFYPIRLSRTNGRDYALAALGPLRVSFETASAAGIYLFIFGMTECPPFARRKIRDARAAGKMLCFCLRARQAQCHMPGTFLALWQWCFW